MQYKIIFKLFIGSLTMSALMHCAHAGKSTLPACPSEYIIKKSILGDGPDERWTNCFGESVLESIQYIGEFQNGLPNGQGLLKHLVTNQYLLGYWKRQRATGQGIAFDERLSRQLTFAIRRANKAIWEEYLETTSARLFKSQAIHFKQCVKAGFLHHRLMDDPQDVPLEKPRSKATVKIEHQCIQFLNSKDLQLEKLLAPNHACKINNINTKCSFVFAADTEKRNEFIEFPIAEIYPYAFNQIAWKVFSKETEDGKYSRQKIESELAQKAKEKADADERERLWKESPEYKNKVAEEQRLKKIEEDKIALEIEKNKLAAENEARKLKIKGYGLGSYKPPCTPIEETYFDIVKVPKRFSYECTVGKRADQITFVFDSTKKKIVSITRIQFDQEPGVLIEAALNFYGKPYLQSSKNWTAIYGTAHMDTGAMGSLRLNDSGVGLGIKGIFCSPEPGITGMTADGREWADGCGKEGAMFVKYELVDVGAYNKSIEDGTVKLQNQRKNRKDF